MNMSIAQYRAVQNRVVKAHREMEIAEMNLRFSEADLRLRVVMHVSPSGGTITLKFDGRELKCVKNSHNRLRVSENKKVIISDYLGDLKELRLALAIGEM